MVYMGRCFSYIKTPKKRGSAHFFDYLTDNFCHFFASSYQNFHQSFLLLGALLGAVFSPALVTLSFRAPF